MARPVNLGQARGRPRLLRLLSPVSGVGGALADVTVCVSRIRNAQMPQPSRMVKECECRREEPYGFFTVLKETRVVLETSSEYLSTVATNPTVL